MYIDTLKHVRRAADCHIAVRMKFCNGEGSNSCRRVNLSCKKYRTRIEGPVVMRDLVTASGSVLVL